MSCSISSTPTPRARMRCRMSSPAARASRSGSSPRPARRAGAASVSWPVRARFPIDGGWHTTAWKQGRKPAAAGARRKKPAVLSRARSPGAAPPVQRAVPAGCPSWAGAGPAMHANEHVLQNAHLVEQALVLEGTRDAQCGDRVGRASDQFSPAVIEGNAACGCVVQPADHVERGGLARAVRADQPGDLSVLDDQIQRLQRTQAARTPSTGRGLRAAPSLPLPGWTGCLSP